MTDFYGQPTPGAVVFAPARLELRAKTGTWWQTIEELRRKSRHDLADRIEDGSPPDMWDGPADKEIVVALSPLDAEAVRQTPRWSGRYRVPA